MGYDTKIHRALEYPIEGYYEYETKQALSEAILPHGLSGSAVWRLNIPENPHDWEPEMAKVLGVAIQWGQDEKTIMVTRSEVIFEFLNRNLSSWGESDNECNT